MNCLLWLGLDCVLYLNGFDRFGLDWLVWLGWFCCLVFVVVGCVRGILERLKALGWALALDAFGTGYSSLTALQNLPFDRLKIDRSFVTNIAKRAECQKIVSGIVSLAQGLHLEVTAEGIETVEDLAYVSYLQCQRGQGFLFEKAVPGDQVGELLDGAWQDLPTVPVSLAKVVGT